MRSRFASGFIFVVVILGGIFGGLYTFPLLFGLVAIGCLWEYVNLVLPRQQKTDLTRQLLGVGLGLIPTVLALIFQLHLFQREGFIGLSALLLFPLLFVAFIFELSTESERPFQNIAFLMLGMIYIGVPFGLLNLIAFENGTFQKVTVLGLVLLTWMNDTGAFAVGLNFGKTPLLPRISPKKTWEGTVGGILITVVTGLIVSIFSAETWLTWVILALLVGIFGSIGDLVESMLKRSCGVKDSGTLMPGHGGLLDRFDAFIFHLPYVAAFLLLK